MGNRIEFVVEIVRWYRDVLVGRSPFILLPRLSAALCVILSLAVGGVASAKKVKPLDKKEKAALAGIESDPAPEKVIQGTHYFVSNEKHPQRFRKALQGVGGMYVGVGAEQGYLFSSWAQPEVIIHADFDQMVVDVHAIYSIFLRASSDADAFIARWDKKNDATSRPLIEKAIDDSTDRKRVLKAFDRARVAIHPRLWGLQLRYGNLGIPTFLNDDDLYRWMVDMHEKGRVRAVRCDLTGDKAMKSIARAAKKMKMPIGGLYLSNVEFYFKYDSGLGDNLRALPTDDGSVVIRTYPFKQKKADYRYFVQKLTHFHAWLDDGAESFRAIFTKDAGTLRDGVWYLNGPK
jgi:hypothetical protein